MLRLNAFKGIQHSSNIHPTFVQQFIFDVGWNVGIVCPGLDSCKFVQKRYIFLREMADIMNMILLQDGLSLLHKVPMKLKSKNTMFTKTYGHLVWVNIWK